MYNYLYSSQNRVRGELYTDYTQLCGTFCSVLRSEDKAKIQHIAHWARLLTECVQCFGSTLKSGKSKKFFRGVSKVFTFERFVTRFNLPTSTTSDVCPFACTCGTAIVHLAMIIVICDREIGHTFLQA